METEAYFFFFPLRKLIFPGDSVQDGVGGPGFTE